MHRIREAVSLEAMLECGLAMAGKRDWKVKRSSRVDLFQELYGAHPLIYTKIWKDLDSIDHERKLGYYLIAIFWLRGYHTECDLAARYDLDEETIRGWCWYYAECIAELQETVIRLPAVHPRVQFPIAVDGIHCRIQEPSHPKDPYDKGVSSKKFGKKAAFAYEVAVCMTDQTISWIRGPYEAGTYTDTVMFEEGGLKYWLLSEKKQAFADAIYTGAAVSTPCGKFDAKEVNQYKRRGRAKTENLNSRFKRFGILNQTFRVKGNQRKRKHGIAFHAVAVIVAYQLQNGSPLLGM